MQNAAGGAIHSFCRSVVVTEPAPALLSQRVLALPGPRAEPLTVA
jgi:hypothetical protein